MCTLNYSCEHAHMHTCTPTHIHPHLPTQTHSHTDSLFLSFLSVSVKRTTVAVQNTAWARQGMLMHALMLTKRSNTANTKQGCQSTSTALQQLKKGGEFVSVERTYMVHWSVSYNWIDPIGVKMSGQSGNSVPLGYILSLSIHELVAICRK